MPERTPRTERPEPDDENVTQDVTWERGSGGRDPETRPGSESPAERQHGHSAREYGTPRQPSGADHPGSTGHDRPSTGYRRGREFGGASGEEESHERSGGDRDESARVDLRYGGTADRGRRRESNRSSADRDSYGTDQADSYGADRAGTGTETADQARGGSGAGTRSGQGRSAAGRTGRQRADVGGTDTGSPQQGSQRGSQRETGHAGRMGGQRGASESGREGGSDRREQFGGERGRDESDRRYGSRRGHGTQRRRRREE